MVGTKLGCRVNILLQRDGGAQLSRITLPPLWRELLEQGSSIDP
jgi:hypothetical protein